MHFNNRMDIFTSTPQALLAGVLIVGLGLFGVGCDAAGTSGGGDGGGGSDTTDTAPPSAPSGLSANPDSAKVGLSWLEVSGADTYNVYRALNPPDSISGDNLVKEISQTSYDDTSVVNGTTYYYVVTALDTAGNESNPSDVTQSTPFEAPSSLEGTYSDNQVKLEWSTAVGAESYNVYRSTSSMDSTGGNPLATGISDTSYTDGSVETDTTYYYRVTSINPEEESAASNEISIDTPIPPPSNLTGESGDSKVKLTWGAVSSDELKGYNVYRDTDSIDDVEGMDPLNTSALTDTSYTDDSAKNRTTYYYVVTSVNTDGNESQPSNEVEKTPFSDPPGRP